MNGDAITINGYTLADNVRSCRSGDDVMIRPFNDPLVAQAGFINHPRYLFDSALMKTSVISDDFRARFLSDSGDPNTFEGRVAVFNGPVAYHARIDDPCLQIDERTILVMRGAGPVGHPGSADVVNMQPREALLRRGIDPLLCLGAGASPAPRVRSILNAAPEAATGGGLALLEDGDHVRIDPGRGDLSYRRPCESLHKGLALALVLTPCDS